MVSQKVPLDTESVAATRLLRCLRTCGLHVGAFAVMIFDGLRHSCWELGEVILGTFSIRGRDVFCSILLAIMLFLFLLLLFVVFCCTDQFIEMFELIRDNNLNIR